ncbi:MAG: TIGR00341 family protein [Ignavibacteria bacterium]|nr:TIGR00341 family protein [Ignavibacteria bacterium]
MNKDSQDSNQNNNQKGTVKNQGKMPLNYKMIYLRVVAIIKGFVNIREGTDTEGFFIEAKETVYLRGPNIWFLLCSTILACIGLDINSSAVIIGAMLISPLMYPILGIGISAGINDEDTILISIREFTFAVIISFLVSTIYFLLTPLGLPTPEILARVKPTILDVGVALFGGTAGIIANSRKKITSAIPGVAIATALLPPLCVSGYGLAKGLGSVFFGAFYLFFINSVFICVASYAVVKFIRLPLKVALDKDKERKRKKYVIAFLIVIIIPSIFIFYSIILEAQMKNRVNSFINKNINTWNNQVIDWRINERGDTLKELKVYVIGDKISASKIDSLNNLMPDYNLDNMKLYVKQVDISADLKSDITQEITSNILKGMGDENGNGEKNLELDSLKKEIEQFSLDSIHLSKALIDIKTFNPGLIEIGYSEMNQRYEAREDSVVYRKIPTLIVQWNRNVRLSDRRKGEEQIYNYLKKELGIDTVQIVNVR